VTETTALPIHDSWRGLTVQEYLALLWPDRSRRALDALFANGRIQSKGQAVARDRSVDSLADLTLRGSLDDVPAIPLPDAGALPEVRILHEDDRFVVLDKPSGLSVVPTRDGSAASCLAFLIQRELSSRPHKPVSEYRRYRVVHRIDRLTSGVLIVAKTSEIERRIGSDFESRRIQKEYSAILAGSPEAARVTIDCPIGPGRKGKMRALGESRPDYRSATTCFEIIDRFENFTYVRALPTTGRTHQIRVHAWAIGHPLAIDPMYGRHPDVEPHDLDGIDRLTLHARRYTLPDDWDEPRSFESPLAEDFGAALDGLRDSRSTV
jgi:23S rRNA pseudouridine1911/1915/1917 synthase